MDDSPISGKNSEHYQSSSGYKQGTQLLLEGGKGLLSKIKGYIEENLKNFSGKSGKMGKHFLKRYQGFCRRLFFWTFEKENSLRKSKIFPDVVCGDAGSAVPVGLVDGGDETFQLRFGHVDVFLKRRVFFQHFRQNSQNFKNSAKLVDKFLFKTPAKITNFHTRVFFFF